MSETIKWKIVKTTSNHKYFDCGLIKTVEEEHDHYWSKTTSWLAVITNIKRDTFNYRSTVMLDRVFVNSKGFKELDADAKYAVLDDLIIKGAKLEVGWKKKGSDGYPMDTERSYDYFEVVDITDKYIEVKKITKQDIIQSMTNQDIAKLKTHIIKAIQEKDDIVDIINTLKNYQGIAKQLLEKEYKELENKYGDKEE